MPEAIEPLKAYALAAAVFLVDSRVKDRKRELCVTMSILQRSQKKRLRKFSSGHAQSIDGDISISDENGVMQQFSNSLEPHSDDYAVYFGTYYATSVLRSPRAFRRRQPRLELNVGGKQEEAQRRSC
ncbi:hypothetical protein ANCCAN_16565 [Ancylostoma caninum]|uniref:Uncharacterized protein n=1 Tax=Ancylostoma caninum TaxID=29170 RepID=A0A368FZI7_ANCCA|nr:hypothetical protein ANCCAN_16565 [Ancylostoma caninum]